MDDAMPESKSSFVRTPNFEKLAQGGMRFANFYAPSPRCTPSRATYFTGKSPAQLHMTFVNEGKRDGDIPTNSRVLPPPSSTELPTKETTITELLKSAGYATAHFGKWHVGRTHPREHGFMESDGPTNNGGPDNVEEPHPKQLFGMTERGMDFMARQVKTGKPFYLQLSHYASRHGGADADHDLDVAFGMVLKKLDELGIANNTYVIFTTDHGTPGKNSPFAGGKGTVSEGGLRVPFIIRGPGIKAGSCSHIRAVGADLFPTMAELARVSEPLPKGIEGGSLVPAFTGGAVKRPREEYVVHFPHYDKGSIGPSSAIYVGNFKLIRVYETGALHLYDIAKDVRERDDLAKKMPDKVTELNRKLDEYLKSVNAQMPTKNPNYDPNKPTGTQREGKRKKGKR